MNRKILDWCLHCSGGGMYDGSRCLFCRGKGVIFYSEYICPTCDQVTETDFGSCPDCENKKQQEL